MSRDLVERFLKKVNKSEEENGCWLWVGSASGNYGKFKYQGRTVYAHRMSYALFKGEPEPNTVVHHKCANRLCVNPSHLTTTTHHENIAEGLSRSELLRRIEKLEAAIQKLQEKNHDK